MRRRSRGLGPLFACAVVAAALAVSPRAFAQPAPGEKRPAAEAKKPGPATAAPADEEKKEDAPKVKVERGAGGKKVYRITTGFVIEGRIQKPNAFYVLQRSQINYDWATLKEDFVPRIVDAVRRSPF